MKKSILVLFAAMLPFFGFAIDAAEPFESKAAVKEKVEVYYFHFTRRCMTCNAVEKEAKKAVEVLYPEQVKVGLVAFIEVNLDNSDSKPAVAKAKAQGQGLIVVSGNKRADLTAQGFRFALSNPSMLQAEIKKAIDPMLASQ